MIWKKKEEEEEEDFKREFVKHAKNEQGPTEQARKEILQEVNGWFHKCSDIAEKFQRPVGNLAVKAIMQRNNGWGVDMKRNQTEIAKKRFHRQNYDRGVTAFHILVSTDIPCDENLSATIIWFTPILLTRCHFFYSDGEPKLLER